MMFGLFPKKQRLTPGTLAADLRDVRKSGVRTAILVTLLVSGVTPALCMFWQNGDNQHTFLAYLKTMVAVAVQSYPLTIAVAVIVISRLQKWFQTRTGRWCFASSVIVFSAAISNCASQITGEGFILPAQLMQEQPYSLWGIPAMVVNTIGGFYLTYGFGMFAASLLIGSYTGVWASRLLKHVPRSKTEVAKLAGDFARIQNKTV